ncbi:CoA-transferase [Micromonospora chalcea]|uniref:CoA-transferase n=1 Tax=Micromonospora chalcea TaxID=1874 RepID=UPI00382F8B4F
MTAATGAGPNGRSPDKVSTLAAAVETHVRPGDVVHVAYADARPNAALHQLVRRFAGRPAGLTLVTAGLVSSQHALVELGVLDRLVASFAGENLPAPRPNRAFQRAVREGRIEVESWSLWSLTARLMAAALGVPHLPVRSLAGSDLGAALHGRGFAEVADPFGGPPSGVVAALRPDVVLLHGVAADRAGNVVLSAPYGEGAWGALAARRGAIASVERIVDTETIREHAALVRVPAHAVLAVCEVPLGSHPYGLFNPGLDGVAGYVPDEEFMAEVVRASNDPAEFRRWIDEWLLGTADHDAYLAKLGPNRIAALRAQAEEDGWRSTLTAAADPPDRWTDAEAMVVTAARRIAGRVRKQDFDAVLAGVGQANLASWLAVTGLQAVGADVELMAEIGMFGYRPRPGEPFIFAHRNLPTCALLTDVATVLGAFVGGPATRSLGVIGAGQVDADGNTNSTYAEDGSYIVGSGGANDIATSAEEVLVTVAHGSHRLVRRVPYVTSPGHGVRTVVSTAGVLERVDGRFMATAFVARSGESDAEAVERLRAGCGWDLDIARDVAREPDPTSAELSALRRYDPARTFLGRLHGKADGDASVRAR